MCHHRSDADRPDELDAQSESERSEEPELDIDDATLEEPDDRIEIDVLSAGD